MTVIIVGTKNTPFITLTHLTLLLLFSPLSLHHILSRNMSPLPVTGSATLKQVSKPNKLIVLFLTNMINIPISDDL